ncbi:MAG: hypothetical protein U0790_23780 [Isosphaeraceae bacterium]
MPGSFDFDPYAVPLAGRAVPIGVYRYDPTLPALDRYALLPNVLCEAISVHEGAAPAEARFRYVLDDSASPPAFPAEFEQLWPLDAIGPHVVRDDDRLVVLATAPSGRRKVLFDGFAQTPGVDLRPDALAVTFHATGVAVRCWDSPIGGRSQRNADDPHLGAVVAVDLPSRFNPDGRPNCTPDGCDVNAAAPSRRYPVVLDPDLDRLPDPRTYWTLGKFVRYILATYNDEKYVKNPDFTRLDALLQARAPRAGAGFVDPAESGSFTAADLVLRDFDATNMPWPDALAIQLGYAGFGLRFVTGDAAGEPRHELEIYRRDGAGQDAPRDLSLPARGSKLDPARCNVSALRLARDSRSIVNAITVETRQRRIEVSVVLAPGFAPAAGDEAASNRGRFLRANLSIATAEDRRKYRSFVADEAGDGHWDLASSGWLAGALDLSAIFPNDPRGTPTYVRRLRPGSNTLISRDAEGRALRAQLALSRDYAGDAPALWDGTGTWQPITGGWELLEDRLGIYVTVDDPDAWPIGEFLGADPQEPSPVLRGITSLANPSPSGPNARFVLRLTTVIDDDLMLPASVSPRPASPTRFTLRRRVDARDHFAMETIAARSLYNPGGDPLVVRDDTPRALAHAQALRAAYELPPLDGRVTLPSLVTTLRVGDRIGRINGRDLSLRANVGGGQGEGPVYPQVVRLTWDFNGERQATVLDLTDRQPDGPGTSP